MQSQNETSSVRITVSTQDSQSCNRSSILLPSTKAGLQDLLFFYILFLSVVSNSKYCFAYTTTPQEDASFRKHLPLAIRMYRQQALFVPQELLSAFPSQMSFSYPNLMTIDLPECSGDNGVAVLEPLFDKLIKKALNDMFYCYDILCHFYDCLRN